VFRMCRSFLYVSKLFWKIDLRNVSANLLNYILIEFSTPKYEKFSFVSNNLLVYLTTLFNPILTDCRVIVNYE
jgi:hypothetical protein